MTSTNTSIRDYRKEIPGSLSDDRLTWWFPTVESMNTNGKKMFWKIYVRVVDTSVAGDQNQQFIPLNDEFFDSKPMPKHLNGWINVDSGIIGMKVRKTAPTIIHKGLNSEKTNATNVFTQALRDAYGHYNKHAKKAHSGADVNAETTDKAIAKCTTEFLPPMLAQILKDQSVKPKISPEHPLYVQRKYNGVRTVTTLQVDTKDDITTYTVVMYSRRKNLYPGFEYIKAELLPILKEYWLAGQKLYLDGEIYKHGVALQDISGQARRDDSANEETLEKYDYMIYDCFVTTQPDLTYSKRKELLDDIFQNPEHKLTYAKHVETFECSSYEEIDALYKTFLVEGFEGAMVRLDTKYNWSYNERHSKVLLKMKPTYDAEFEVVGMSAEGKGKAAGALMIICKTTAGKHFPVTPAMEIVERIALAQKMKEVEPNGKTHFENHWFGKPLIVYFDELSKDKLPQRARTKLEIRTWQ